MNPLIYSSLRLLLILGLIVGCRQESITLEFVVPTGFTGILKLRDVGTEGPELAATNGTMVLNFPASGVLDIQGPLPTLKWHSPVARFADGRAIPVPAPQAFVPNDVIALRGLGGKPGNTEVWFLVGKADQMQEAMNKFYGFEVPRR